MQLISPERNVLRRLDGNAGDIERRGQDLVDAAAVMNRTANQLRKISEGTREIAIAISVNAVREQAAETFPDLEKAAIRYERTGGVLKTYASALETAQNSIHPKIDDIERAHLAAQEARQAEAEARSVVRDHGTQMPWEADVSDAAKQEARADLQAAEGSLGRAESTLESLWGQFDRAFSTWSDAYDDAVEGIEDAFEAADNDDAWGEDLLPVLGWIAVGLAVVALFVTGPIALAILAIGAVVAAAMLTINLLKFAKGRGNWLDLTMSIVGLVPFARPLIQGARGGLAALRGTSALFSTGRGILRTSIRSMFPRLGYTPMSGGPLRMLTTGARNLWAAGVNGFANIGAGLRYGSLMTRFRMHDMFLTRPMANAFGGGHNIVTSFSSFIMRNGDDVGVAASQWSRSAPVLAEAPSTIARNASRFEFGGTWVANSDFMASANISAYADWRGRFAQ
jgi:hypothetical protein